MLFSAPEQCGIHGISSLIFGDELINRIFANGIDYSHEVAYAVGINGVAEL
ncbi:hypothetical protein GALL_511070 [mine drainage metagenome]|uniref:Uncharacterized protein n=1 Tax=mine drainage metagenome TaxID=410659 RepID=A0A1J5P7X9_9ZZZZ